MASSTLLPKKPFNIPYQLLSDIEEQETTFLWEPYIPNGALTLLAGQGGMGKSYITCALATAISRGLPLPGHSATLPPQKVLMISAEDNASRVIKPRMRMLGADMSKIYVSGSTFTLNQQGIDSIRKIMTEVAATVVFLDPIVSYLGAGMDINKSNETRAMLGPLARAAEETNTAVIAVAHINKSNQGSLTGRIMGSADFGNAARSVLVVDKKEGQRFMVHSKANWSKQGPALAYKFEDNNFQWQGPYAYNEDGGEQAISKTPFQRTQAKDFLFNLLKDGPLSASEVTKLAKAAGFSDKTLFRAKKGLVYSERQPNGHWIWGLEERRGLVSAPRIEKSPESVYIPIQDSRITGEDALLQEALSRIGRGE